jgi:hypothetical protein
MNAFIYGFLTILGTLVLIGVALAVIVCAISLRSARERSKKIRADYE